MNELLEVKPQEPRDAGTALSLEINRCARWLEERHKAYEQASDEGLALFGELGLTRVENELKKAGFALMSGEVEKMKAAVAALKEVK